jgi:hypothetical protein
MNTYGYLNTRGYPHSGYPRGTGQARVSYLSNGAETDIIQSVPMGPTRYKNRNHIIENDTTSSSKTLKYDVF